jgi:hypothetical protein
VLATYTTCASAVEGLMPGIARSIQLAANRREDRVPEVRLAVVAQGAAYRRQGLCSQWYESGI